MSKRVFPIYGELAKAVMSRDSARGVMPLPDAADTAIKAMLTSTDYALWFAADAAAKFGADTRLALDENNRAIGEPQHSELPPLKLSRAGLELAALVLADIRLRERGPDGDPDGGSPTFAGNIDDFLMDLSPLVPKRGDFRNPDPGGGGSALPTEFEYRRAA